MHTYIVSYIAKFTELVKKFGLRLSQSLLKEIIHIFPGVRNTVDQELLKAVYLKQYPDTKPPPEKPARRKKAKRSKKKKKAKAKKKKP